MKKLTNEQKAILETLIDETNLASVIDALNTICYEKADHIQASYSDQYEAMLWKRAGAILYKLSNKIQIKMVSL